MDLGLKAKLAIVSGSTAGIGFAIAATLAREGARIVINGRTPQRVSAAAERIRMELRGAEVTEAPADLGTAEGVGKLIEQVPSADILVNNLGIFDPKPFLEIPDSEWLRFYEVNVMSGVRLTRHYLPGMLERKWGRVIFISSESGQQIPAEMVHYGMTKTAQIAIARGIAESVPGSGVTVNSILAGPTASEGVGDFVQSMAKRRGVSPAQIEKEFFETVRPSSLLKRFETAEEVAAIVAFVASTQSVGINGAAVRAEGGVVKSIL
ncbi:MAG TPA: SDR family NAD(P)-dependent oxidoreductase [Candidatus Eisenbacteria bacterium]|jgi:NAD(P)-dependent dehydrogenase (short-subunit alcohol dehydrogenase family)|nr:SDR family NAD(P)-dependent oxidoreductase [Candidatus Eisenbacteria bacterium]